MRRIAAAVLSAVALAAAAQTTAPVYVFTAVDGVRLTPNRLWITGVVEGESAARELEFIFNGTATASILQQLESCQRLALLAMTKPGQYRLTVWNETYSYSYAFCSLARVAP